MKYPSRRNSMAGSRTPKRIALTRRPWQRMLQIHDTLVANKFPNCQTLAREIEVTPKTILRDISYMRDEMSLPLEYHPIEHGYYYTSPVENFPTLHLSRTDLIALFLARKAMEPLKGTRMETVLAESFSKIAEACAGEVSFRWSELDEAFSVRAVGVGTVDVELFSHLVDAVVQTREVTFAYRKLGARKAVLRRVHPYHVGQIEQAWYLVAYDPQRSAIRKFALPRIAGLAVLKTRFNRDDTFNITDYLTSGFGVWGYDEDARGRYDVHLRFEGYAARVVEERKWHPTQQIIKLESDDEAIEFHAKVAGLEEMTRWVLGWGSKVRILSPNELRERVKKEAEAVCAAQ